MTDTTKTVREAMEAARSWAAVDDCCCVTEPEYKCGRCGIIGQLDEALRALAAEEAEEGWEKNHPQHADTRRLDYLQGLDAPSGFRWSVYKSTTGRGWRLATTSRSGGKPSVRESIDEAMALDDNLRALIEERQPEEAEPEPCGDCGGTLECPCCGGDAASWTSAKPIYDGDPITCGCPGSVYVDEDHPGSVTIDESQPCPKCARSCGTCGGSRFVHASPRLVSVSVKPCPDCAQPGGEGA